MKLLFDFFPILLFFIAYKIYGIYAATAVAIGASFIQVALFWMRHRRFENMHLITLGLIGVLGGATLWLQNETFIQWKPTVVNWLFGLAFFASRFIGRKPLVQRMMGAALELPDVIWQRLNSAWALFFIGSGFLNLYVVYNFDTDFWVNFKLFGLMGLTIAFVIGQAFFLVRHMKPQTEGES
ncbi:septation protein A [Thiohalomonas denitrificans]|uniref:Inner membrane-spanning protein YciB n=1 Tax=Thiohalomonas denitrificans TaxID=415747 RepID=A0A1G5PIG6_9GAMM|nr:septation protein A [Thiohalomonas denitrificans]SCZ49303.1 intracellular septation protein [Thiohalomonas denitrificans]